MHRNPAVRGLVAKPEDCHPTNEDLSVGTPVGVVQLLALRGRSRRKSRDRIAVERDAAGQPVAGISALPGKGRLRSEVSQVPKSEAPGAPIVVCEPAEERGALHRKEVGHVSPRREMRGNLGLPPSN